MSLRSVKTRAVNCKLCSVLRAEKSALMTLRTGTVHYSLGTRQEDSNLDARSVENFNAVAPLRGRTAGPILGAGRRGVRASPASGAVSQSVSFVAVSPRSPGQKSVSFVNTSQRSAPHPSVNTSTEYIRSLGLFNFAPVNLSPSIHGDPWSRCPIPGGIVIGNQVGDGGRGEAGLTTNCACAFHIRCMIR